MRMVVLGVLLLLGLNQSVTGNQDRIPEATDNKDSNQKEASSAEAVQETDEEPVLSKPRSSACLVDASALEDLKNQKEFLEKEKQKLELKARELEGREQALNEELKKLEEIRSELQKTNTLKKAENEAKVAKLVETLQTMSPKASAKLISEIDETLAIAAIQKMDTLKLAKIMNLIEPAKSSRLSELLVGVAPTNGSTGVRTPAQATRKDSAPQQKGGE